MGEKSVVGGKETPLGRFHQGGASVGADAGVYHPHMYGVIGKVSNAVVEQERALQDILGRHAVGDINNLGVWVDAQDDSLHQANVRVLKAEVRRQRDDGLRREQGTCPRSASL